MYPWLCICTLYISHVYIVKKYGKGKPKKGGKRGVTYFFPIFGNKLMNGNTIEAYMKKISKIA